MGLSIENRTDGVGGEGERAWRLTRDGETERRWLKKPAEEDEEQQLVEEAKEEDDDDVKGDESDVIIVELHNGAERWKADETGKTLGALDLLEYVAID